MNKKQKEIIEKCYKDINNIRDEAGTVQETIDEIKDEVGEGNKGYDSLYNSNNNLDGAITSLDHAAEYLRSLIAK